MRIKLASTLFISGLLLLNPFKGLAAPAFDSASLLKVYEDSMKSLQFIRINARTDKEKMDANSQLVSLMNKALLLPGSFTYPFDSLTTIGKLTSADKQVRIITWDVPKSGCTYGYFGFIQAYNVHKKKYDIFLLEDHTTDIANPQTATCTPNKWIGMLYYKIIKEKGSNTYTLLAWQGYNKQTTRKVIDILTFNTQGIPSFGKALYVKLPASFKGNPKRLIFEYSADVSMSIKYDESKHMILFDRLAPIQEGLESQHQYYSPSFIVDALIWKNGTWNYQGDVDARNSSNEKEDSPQKPANDINKKTIYTTPH